MEKRDDEHAWARGAAESINSTTPGGYHPKGAGVILEALAWALAGGLLLGFVALIGKCSHAAG